MRKVLSALLALTMILSLVPAFAVSTQALQSGKWQYEVSGGEATITGFDKSVSGAVVIPSQLGGYPVTTIGAGAFYGYSFTYVTVPSSVTEISEFAFGCCEEMTGITIPSSVTSIGERAFFSCLSLTSIVIPDSVKVLGGHSFSACISLKNVTIPASVTTIGDYAFNGCAGLTGINIPASVTAIGNGAFYDCTGLKSIDLPSSVTSIGERAFNGCTGLTSINIPSSVTSIGEWAFNGCTGLTSINIPASVTSIGYDAFDGCAGLTVITVDKNNTVYASGGNCLTEKSSGTLIRGCETSVIPQDGSVTAIGDYAFNGCTGLTSIDIPEGVTDLKWGAFEGCVNLTRITVPKSMIYIDDSTFKDCGKLTIYGVEGSYSQTYAEENGIPFVGRPALIEDPKWQYEISGGEATLVGAENPVLSDVVIPALIDGYPVTAIRSSAIAVFKEVSSITIPASVTEIELYTFDSCFALTSITVDSNNPVYESSGNCLINKSTKTLIVGLGASVIPADGSVTSIGSRAFGWRTGLTSINIPSTVTEIGEYAFSGTDLTSVTISKGVTAIGFCAFAGCTGLTLINIPESVTSIDSFTFKNCENLTICGVKGSYAETYAKENGIPFVEYRELADTSSGVTVGGSVPENAELSVVVKEQTAEKAMFDISLVADGVTVQPNGSVRVALPVPQGMNGADMRVYHIADNGAKTDMNAVYSNGFMVFDTDHFSVYSIEPNPSFVCGDANGDGTVDISDAMLVLYHVAGKNLLPGSVLARCDTDDSGTVDIVDAMKILYYVANKTDSVK